MTFKRMQVKSSFFDKITLFVLWDLIIYFNVDSCSSKVTHMI